jgi:WhiB family redox-sensing transcriptional regulator
MDRAKAETRRARPTTQAAGPPTNTKVPMRVTEPAEAYVEIAASGAASWLAGALCAQTDPEAFFPEKGESALAALAVCRRCEVRAECLAWALEHHQRFGVWGGVTESDRRGMRWTDRHLFSQIPTGGEAA